MQPLHSDYLLRTAPSALPRWFGPFAFCIPFLAFLAGLGATPLFDVDEGAFAQATLEMFSRDDFLFTYLNGEPRFDKPILIYWLQAVSVWIFGPSEWAFRLPSALCGITWAFAAWHFARPRFGAVPALIALVMVSTALGPFIIGRAATADALLNLLLCLTLFDLWRHMESRHKAPLIRVYLWAGLGFLTKGPVAFLIPFAVTFLYCLSLRQWGFFFRMLIQPTGWLILALVTLPWYAHAYATHGQDFLDGFFLRHNVERFSGTLEGHAGSFFYYALMLPLLVLPWTVTLAHTLWNLKEDRQLFLRRFLWIWAGFVLVFFSLSGTKLPHYALYGITPLFLLMAHLLPRLEKAVFHGLLALLLPLFFLVLPLALEKAVQQGIHDGYYAAMLARAPEVLPAYHVFISLALIALTVFIFIMRSRPLWQKLVFCALLQSLSLSLWIGPYVGELLQGPVRRAGEVARAQDAPAVNWNFTTVPSFSVYRNDITPSRAPLVGEMALMRIDRLPENGLADFELLYQEGGVVLARRLR
jgi:4-amino-4-deoxy-L-arabinose transferase-like glycosyltransferase